MANGISPYQVAAPTVNLMQTAAVRKKKGQESQLATRHQMGTMEEAFQQEIEKLGLTASRRERGSSGRRGLETGLQVLSMFTNPLLAGLIGGFLGRSKHRRARKAREGLLNLNKRWGNTFLRGKGRDYLAEAESMQLDEKGDWTEAIKSGVISGLTSKLMGGTVKGGEGGSFADKFFGRDVKGFADLATTATDKSMALDPSAKGYSATKPGFFEGSKLVGKDADAKSLLAMMGLVEKMFQEPQY